MSQTVCNAGDQAILKSLFPVLLNTPGNTYDPTAVWYCDSANKYVAVDPTTGSMTSLIFGTLDLSKDTTTFAANIAKLTKLAVLSIPNTGLSSLPDSLCSMTTLQRIDFGNQIAGPPTNTITTVPNCFAQMTSLTKIVARNLPLATLPTNVFQNLNQLTYLDLRLSTTSNSFGSLGLTNSPGLQYLDLNGNKLTGSLTDIDWSQFKQLTYLDVSYNQFTGSFPTSLGTIGTLQSLSAFGGFTTNQYYMTGAFPDVSAWSSLTTLDIHNNRLTGDIGFLNSLKSLTTMDISVNMFSGQLPSNFANTLSGATILNLNNMSLTGPIPNLSNMVKLTSIVLGRNKFTGGFPDLSQLVAISNIDLSYNQLSGAIPDNWGTFPALQTLSLQNNSFAGAFPPSLVTANLPKLNLVNIANNQLTGVIPNPGTLLTSLQQLILSGNGFTGSIPATVGSLTNLITLKLDNNKLSGTIPAGITGCALLQTLNLDSNQLTGSIPDALKSFTTVRTLSANNNQLSGNLPKWMFDKGITKLSLANNQLNGPIPLAVKASDTTLTYLDLSYNSFNGTIPDVMTIFAPSTGFLLMKKKKLHRRAISTTLSLNLMANYLRGTLSSTVISTFGTKPFALNCLSNAGLAIRSTCASGGVSGTSADCALVRQTFPTVDFGGVDCTNTTAVNFNLDGKINSLTLSGLTLTGSIPTAIGALVNLTTLDLSSNVFVGSIPTALNNLVNLKTLLLQNNNLTGTVPSNLSSIIAKGTSNFGLNCLVGQSNQRATCVFPTTTSPAPPKPTVYCNQIYNPTYEALFLQYYRAGQNFQPAKMIPGDAFGPEYKYQNYRHYVNMRLRCLNGDGTVGGINWRAS